MGLFLADAGGVGCKWVFLFRHELAERGSFQDRFDRRGGVVQATMK
jgi:hypothetical protein